MRQSGLLVTAVIVFRIAATYDVIDVLWLLDERDIDFSDTVYNAIVLFRWRIPDV